MVRPARCSYFAERNPARWRYTGSGYRVIELWDFREQCQAFLEGHIAPNLPPGAEPPALDFFDLYFEIKPAT